MYDHQYERLWPTTLTWDGPTSDLDHHVNEPGGALVKYSNKQGEDGFLDFDDTDGFGPEHYIISDQEKLTLNEDLRRSDSSFLDQF